MEWKAETWVALYAAIVSTGALLIQVRAWATSGARLRINVIPDGIVFGGDPIFDERDIIIVSATNVGTANTIITGLSVEHRDPFYYFWRRKALASFVMANPQLKGYPPNTPQKLEPAHTWTGAIRQRPDLIPDIRNGDYYACVHTSTRQRPYRQRIATSRRPRHLV